MSAKAGSAAFVGNGATLRGFALANLAAALAAASREAAEETSSPCSAANALARGAAALTDATAAGKTREISKKKMTLASVALKMQVKADAQKIRPRAFLNAERCSGLGLGRRSLLLQSFCCCRRSLRV